APMMWIKREDAFAELVELLTRHHVDDEPPFTLQTANNLSAHSARICKDDPAGFLCIPIIFALQHGTNRAFPRRNVEVIARVMPSRQRGYLFSLRIGRTGVGRIDPVPPSLERIGWKRDTAELRFVRVERRPINLDTCRPKASQSMQHVY